MGLFERGGGSIFLRASRSEGGIVFGVKKTRPDALQMEREGCWESVPPKVLEARRAQLSISRGVGDRDVAKPILDCPSVDAIVGELVAA
jgi:hypothetical protein